jgi:hypothetical protein
MLYCRVARPALPPIMSSLVPLTPPTASCLMWTRCKTTCDVTGKRKDKSSRLSILILPQPSEDKCVIWFWRLLFVFCVSERTAVPENRLGIHRGHVTRRTMLWEARSVSYTPVHVQSPHWFLNPVFNNHCAAQCLIQMHCHVSKYYNFKL